MGDSRQHVAATAFSGKVGEGLRCPFSGRTGTCPMASGIAPQSEVPQVGEAARCPFSGKTGACPMASGIAPQHSESEAPKVSELAEATKLPISPDAWRKGATVPRNVVANWSSHVDKGLNTMRWILIFFIVFLLNGLACGPWLRRMLSP